MVKITTLTAGLEKLNLGFDKKAWSRKYFKTKARCPRCMSLVCKHLLKRHWATDKCRFITALLKEAKGISN